MVVQDCVKGLTSLLSRISLDRSVVNPYWLACWAGPCAPPARQAHQSPLQRGCLFQIDGDGEFLAFGARRARPHKSYFAKLKFIELAAMIQIAGGRW